MLRKTVFGGDQELSGLQANWTFTIRAIRTVLKTRMERKYECQSYVAVRIQSIFNTLLYMSHYARETVG